MTKTLNYKNLETRRSKCLKEGQKVDNDLRMVLTHSRNLDRDMNALKPEIITLFKQRQQMAKDLVTYLQQSLRCRPLERGTTLIMAASGFNDKNYDFNS